ncbi:50S ribosomal protein L23 [Aureibacter tunicatorum]|uniref:Large ribosomal subunit protein uL23 n=1 Tax=Aureibacter tunicatorum TaxID=866807 RepID=A0AAE3XJU5_9BACT|nr:50S ribosomal protein L23 [Aureibacter tunicatorum]MDR6237963.1 large subunit ribosomal protein L23 [Aureibacter tunicatorum]BDD02996.1 50S ribosomal protein L23 [Aureibacter tunicatorum]
MSILKRPLLTEKASAQNEEGVYGFVVATNANKIEIKKAVEKTYGVNVKSVRTINYLGKKKSRYTKSQVITGRSTSYKKAIVKVAEGEVIDFYSGI